MNREDEARYQDATEEMIRMRDPKKSIFNSDPTKWTQEEAVRLCRAIEAICPEFGCHIALTGGALYKDGPRKDCDLLFYRIRQEPAINQYGLFEALEAIGFSDIRGLGWCFKGTYAGKNCDLFFPEKDSGEYSEEQLEEAAQARMEVRAWREIRAAEYIERHGLGEADLYQDPV